MRRASFCGGSYLSTFSSTGLTIALLSVVITALIRPAFAQTDYSQQIGAPVFSSIEPVELGFVNAANGNLHLEIPIASFPQRGMKQPLTYKLVYDSRIWGIPGIGYGYLPNKYTNPYPTTPWTGWRFITSADYGTVGQSPWTTLCGSNPVLGDQKINNFWWKAPDG